MRYINAADRKPIKLVTADIKYLPFSTSNKPETIKKTEISFLQLSEIDHMKLIDLDQALSC